MNSWGVSLRPRSQERLPRSHACRRAALRGQETDVRRNRVLVVILTWPDATVVVLSPSKVVLLCLITYFGRWRIHRENTKLVGIKIEDPLPCTNDAGPKCSLMSIGAFVQFFLFGSMDSYNQPPCFFLLLCCLIRGLHRIVFPIFDLH